MGRKVFRSKTKQEDPGKQDDSSNPAARFDDPQTVKIVALNPASRRQQVNDECFQGRPHFRFLPGLRPEET